jgi:hypothetical protein
MVTNYTQKPQVKSTPFDDSSSPVTVKRGAMTTAQWSEIAFEVFDAAGAHIEVATGVISGKSRVSGAGKFCDFEATLDLAVDCWNFLPNQSAVNEFQFTIVGLNVDYTVVATITSWN